MEFNMIALFSGRFDPPHPGHIIQVLRLLKKYNKVILVILDSKERFFPISYCVPIFKEIFLDKNVEVESNLTHFGEITKEELGMFNFDVYVSGNLKVLRHIETLGRDVEYIERAYDYAASKYSREE